MSEVYVHKKDLEQILETMEKINPINDCITINVDNSSGIGSVVTAEFKVNINGVEGCFRQVIVDHNDW